MHASYIRRYKKFPTKIIKNSVITMTFDSLDIDCIIYTKQSHCDIFEIYTYVTANKT